VELGKVVSGSSEITTVVGCWGNCLVERLPLNQFAPFHIVEKKRLGLIGVVQVSEGYGSSGVETVEVVSELSNGRWGKVKEVPSIQSVVAEKLP
jgi:hypothetical protein